MNRYCFREYFNLGAQLYPDLGARLLLRCHTYLMSRCHHDALQCMFCNIVFLKVRQQKLHTDIYACMTLHSASAMQLNLFHRNVAVPPAAIHRPVATTARPWPFTCPAVTQWHPLQLALALPIEMQMQTTRQASPAPVHSAPHVHLPAARPGAVAPGGAAALYWRLYWQCVVRCRLKGPLKHTVL